jgi:thioredoxin-dependent peroxiredoxin
MSKKTRKKSPKKSPKTASGKAARAQSVASAKTPPSKTRRATANKSGKDAGKQAGNATAKASHKPPSKQLKPARATASKGPATAKATAATPKAANKARNKAGKPSPRKPAAAKPDAPAARGSGLTDGARAPAFRLPRDGGSTVSLSDFAGAKLVLFFYPRADTPGCTKEAIDFTRLAGAFAESRTVLLGVSADPLKAQEAFRDKHQLATPLASDEQHKVLEAYGVWGEKSMYGRTFQGILRTTVLIGADSRILRIWRNVKVDGHADEVLAAVRAL